MRKTRKTKEVIEKQISLGKRETGAKAALPIWLQFMQAAVAGTAPTDFPNVVPLEQQAGEHLIHVDTPDTAPTEDEPPCPVRNRPLLLRRQKLWPPTRPPSLELSYTAERY